MILYSASYGPTPLMLYDRIFVKEQCMCCHSSPPSAKAPSSRILLQTIPSFSALMTPSFFPYSKISSEFILVTTSITPFSPMPFFTSRFLFRLLLDRDTLLSMDSRRSSVNTTHSFVFFFTNLYFCNFFNRFFSLS